MLKLLVPGREWYNEETEEFIVSKDCVLLLEHSLLSVSKWEAKWKKPFLNTKEKRTREESVDYVRCMTINKGVDPFVYYNITPLLFKQINDYIEDSMTATTINHRHDRPTARKEIVTSEVIYYWMVENGIPFECEKWHLNRLMTLINVCTIKSSPGKKMSQKDILKENAALNAARKAKKHTKG